MTTLEKNKILDLSKTTVEVYQCPECGKIYEITDNLNRKYALIQHMEHKHSYLFDKIDDTDIYEYAEREQGFSDFLECGDK
jgi:uncharacterized C2H2 Zn-finger protein